MRNCGVCHIGLAFDPTSLDAYAAVRHRTSVPGLHNTSPLPEFGSLHQADSHVSCEFAHLANPRLPLIAICYHFNVTSDELKEFLLRPNTSKNVPEDPSSHPAVQLCSKMEVIFSDDGDEYAGQPDTTASAPLDGANS
ncbi:unnamed protein product [Echinostoma caproni]|uniref:Ubiquitinyl hydrolase 1 n=1 Tax=Echinostoma caproni TaxID=27848 RepID=A0A183AJL7_9TREM|nr:unnamed protein product [Echinostoma caproni]